MPHGGRGRSKNDLGRGKSTLDSLPFLREPLQGYIKMKRETGVQMSCEKSGHTRRIMLRLLFTRKGSWHSSGQLFDSYPALW